MRQIVLDTETTGLDSQLGHRIVELACVEVVNRKITGRHFQRYINPERDIDEGAKKVHGLTELFLSDKPKFGEIVEEFLNFISDSELIIHNAPFDEAFLDNELSLCSKESLITHVDTILDSLVLAKSLYPGKRNSLDALCDRHKVDNSKRSIHGALLDSRLLAECYLSMTRGQESLLISGVDELPLQDDMNLSDIVPNLIVEVASEEELGAHNLYLKDLSEENSGECIWLRRDEKKEG